MAQLKAILIVLSALIFVSAAQAQVNEASIRITQDDLSTGEPVEIETYVTEQMANNEYKIEITGPETKTKNIDRGAQQNSDTFTFEESGTYTVKIVPKMEGQDVSWVQEIIEGEAVASKEIEVGEGSESGTGQEGEISIKIPQEDLVPGDPIEVETFVTEEMGENGYRVEITGPETKTKNYDEGTQHSYTFTVGTAGTYTVEIVPQVMGQEFPLLGEIVEEEVLASKQIYVGTSGPPRWIQYCENQGHETGTIPGKVECIDKTIVDEFFNENKEVDDTEVPESICQDLLSYTYSESSKACTPQ